MMMSSLHNATHSVIVPPAFLIIWVSLTLATFCNLETVASIDHNLNGARNYSFQPVPFQRMTSGHGKFTLEAIKEDLQSKFLSMSIKMTEDTNKITNAVIYKEQERERGTAFLF